MGVAERCSEHWHYIWHQENMHAFLRKYLDFFSQTSFFFDNQRLLQIVLASEKQGLRVWNSLESMEIFKVVFQAEKK